MENRDVPCVRDAGDVLHEFGAPGRIKRRQRLVHEQQAGAAEQGAPYGHALFLAAGERGGHAPQQMGDAQQFDGILKGKICAVSGAARAEALPEEQIFPHAEVGEKPSVLKDVSDFAPFGREMDALFRVEPDIPVAFDAPRVRLQQSGNAVDQGALAGTGRAEQRADGAFRKAELHVQGKVSQAFAQGHGQHIVRQHSSW